MKSSTIVIGATKSKNQNYVPNIIFFLQSWIQIRIKDPNRILKKVTKPKHKTKTCTKQALNFLEWNYEKSSFLDLYFISYI